MKLGNKRKKRLGVYFFYDGDGVVDGFVKYFLEEYRKCVERLIIVVNGNLTKEGEAVFRSFTQDLIVRENEGLDVWAYKTAFEYMGWEKLQEYDETVIANCTVMGPVYPLRKVFEEMEDCDVDFWGMSKYYRFDHSDLDGRIPYGYIPEHIQSYFMVYRSSLVKAKEFHDYWDQMPPVKNYHDSIGFFEAVFTKKFADYGFQWDVYVDTDDMEHLTQYAMLDYPMELIRDRKCPFFKRRSFLEDYHTVQDSTLGQPCSELYDYLRENHLYPVELIWQNILRTCHQSDIAKNLHLNYVLPVTCENREEIERKLEGKKTALFMHLYFMDILESSLRYASAMPAFSDVYITTNTKEKKELIEEKFSALACGHLEVRVIENRGRDVSGLLVGLRGIPEKYEYACFFHDKKAGQENPGSIGDSFGYKCSRNVLYNRDYVYQILNTFEENPQLGILSAPEPNHGPYFPTLGDEWHDNFEITKELADRLGLHVPMSPEKEPVAPFGSVFWYRTKALKKLQEYPWSYEDFPPEPLAIDHTISHAIERVRPFAAQDAGYYPAFVMTEEYARIEYTNLHQYVRNYNEMLRFNGQLVGTQKEILSSIDDFQNGKYKIEETPLYMRFAAALQEMMPQKAYDSLIGVKRRIFGPHDLTERDH